MMYFWNSLSRRYPCVVLRPDLQEDQLPFLPRPAFKAEPCFFPCLCYHCSSPRVTYLTSSLGRETFLELLAGTRASFPPLSLFLPELLECFHLIAICWKASCSKRTGNISESPSTRLSIPWPGLLTLKLLLVKWTALDIGNYLSHSELGLCARYCRFVLTMDTFRICASLCSFYLTRHY